MKRVLAVVAAVAVLSSGASLAQPRGSPPLGSYWQSCRNVSTVDRGPNAMVTAECRDERGRWRQTSLRFAGCREIYNRDGELTCRDSAGAGYPGARYPNGAYPNAAYPADSQRSGGYPGGSYPGGGYPGGHGALTLFSGPDFSGQPFTTTSEITNLPRQSNDRAMSLRIDGRGAWEVCSDSDFRGRCQVFDRDVGDLRRSGLAGQVSSMRRVR